MDWRLVVQQQTLVRKQSLRQMIMVTTCRRGFRAVPCIEGVLELQSFVEVPGGELDA